MIEGIVLTLLGTAATVLATKYYTGKIVKVKQHHDEQNAFSGLAQTLANDYTSIYYVNVEDDSYAEYGAAGIDKRLTKLAEGTDFFAAVKRDAERLIYPEDLEEFLAALTKEKLLIAAKNDGNFTLDYRLLVNGEPLYYRLKLIRGMGEGGKHLILGVRDVDEQTKREAAAAEESETYNQIAKALAAPYEVIYYVDTVTNEYTEYSSSAKYTKLEVGTHGYDFFGETQENMKRDIFPEDYPMMAESMQKDKFLAELNIRGTYSLTYRLMLDQNPEYVNLRAVKSANDDRYIIVAVSNIDASMRRDMKLQEEHVTFSRLALSLANDYLSIYYINTEDDSYVEYGATGREKKLTVLSEGSDFFADTEKNCRTLVYEEDQERFMASLNKKALLDAMQEEESFSLNYRLVIDGEPVHYYLKTIRGTGPDDKYIIIGVRNVDVQTKREAAAAAESATYSQIAKALATPYEVIYYVDTVTDEYTEYSSSDKYTKLKVGSHGYDFFGDTQRNMKRDIFPEDYPMMAASMQKERFLEELSSAGTYSLTYRLMLGGNPEYVNLRAVKSGMDNEHIIVAVSNIDASVRREMAFRKELGTAMNAANQDSLTGVNSKHAYLKVIDNMNDEIEQGADYEFAIIVFDVNDLKKVNDTKGHSAGDEYIKSACRMFCTVFNSSQIYRIGGDEFVALLIDNDYQNRNELLGILQKMVMDNKEKGLVTIASGMAVYDKNSDRSVTDVFERADNAMYANKKLLKG